jgi:hypothetical protein
MTPEDDDPPPSLRQGFPLTFWLSLGFCALCIAAGAAVAWLGPSWR